MNGLSVIIPSRNITNLVQCVRAVRMHDSDCEIIVVDDGLGEWPWTPTEESPVYVPGESPFIFARNCNIGIRAAGSNDVVLLNDDALLKTSGGFRTLQRLADSDADYGVIGAVTNVTGQPLQFPLSRGLRVVPHFAFVAVLIPRHTIDQVGPLDERYAIDYGCEDRDYCEACRRAGLKVGVYDFCYVDHGSLTSTYRGDPHVSRSFARNHALFEDKWRSA